MSGGMLLRKTCEIWVPHKAGNALELLKSHVFVSLSSSGMGTLIQKVKGMGQVVQKWGSAVPKRRIKRSVHSTKKKNRKTSNRHKRPTVHRRRSSKSWRTILLNNRPTCTNKTAFRCRRKEKRSIHCPQFAGCDTHLQSVMLFIQRLCCYWPFIYTSRTFVHENVQFVWFRGFRWWC